MGRPKRRRALSAVAGGAAALAAGIAIVLARGASKDGSQSGTWRPLDERPGS